MFIALDEGLELQIHQMVANMHMSRAFTSFILYSLGDFRGVV